MPKQTLINKSMQESAVQVRCSLGRASRVVMRKQALEQVQMLEQAKQNFLVEKIDEVNNR
jgi:hypothetical protein